MKRYKLKDVGDVKIIQTKPIEIEFPMKMNNYLKIHKKEKVRKEVKEGVSCIFDEAELNKSSQEENRE